MKELAGKIQDSELEVMRVLWEAGRRTAPHRDTPHIICSLQMGRRPFYADCRLRILSI
jgi:hypothetical protein